MKTKCDSRIKPKVGRTTGKPSGHFTWAAMGVLCEVKVKRGSGAGPSDSPYVMRQEEFYLTILLCIRFMSSHTRRVGSERKGGKLVVVRRTRN